MKTEYWFQKWERNQIAFHEGEANSLLQAHFQRLALKAGARIFLPLCGKTRDIPWLLTKGHRVVGAELVEGAVERLFHELEIEPRVSEAGKLRRYQAANLDVFAGDIFELSGEVLGAVDAVYDRAALVALEPALRDRYAKHLIRITGAAPQLLIVYDS
ncbi:MAG: thiopurine S-methyltransferase, partial [Leptospirales bacterium]